MRNRKAALVMAGAAILLLAAVGMWTVRVLQPGTPADVRRAAEQLNSSRVGYAMEKPDRTYLIISTGEQGPKVKIDRMESQPAGSGATLMDVSLKTAADGRRLIIATAPATPDVAWQFNLDGTFAAIPTLFNRDGLPLVHLDEAHSFSVITPARNALVAGPNVVVTGYARVFEAAFMVKVITADGREVGSAPVHAAAGAPNWGSFSASVPINRANLTKTGSIILQGDGPALLTVPVRFQGS